MSNSNTNINNFVEEKDSNQCDQNDISFIRSEKAVLLYGESQVGKTTLAERVYKYGFDPIPIDDIKYDECESNDEFDVGNGNGESVTQHPQFYTKRLPAMNMVLHLIDPPGAMDTRLRWTPQKILQNIEFAITSGSNTVVGIDAILVAESLVGDRTQLVQNLRHLKQVFGMSVMNSIVVLGLKPALSERMYNNRRIAHLQRKCANELGLPFVMIETIDREYQQRPQQAEQRQLLLDLVSGNEVVISNRRYKLTPYPMSEITKNRAKIKERAQELLEDAPKRYSTQEVVVDKQIQEPYSVQESYQEYGGKRLFGGRKLKTRYRTVTRYRPKTVQEKKEVVVEVPLELDPFLVRAQKEWETQVRDSFNIQIQFNCRD